MFCVGYVGKNTDTPHKIVACLACRKNKIKNMYLQAYLTLTFVDFHFDFVHNKLCVARIDNDNDVIARRDPRIIGRVHQAEITFSGEVGRDCEGPRLPITHSLRLSLSQF